MLKQAFNQTEWSNKKGFLKKGCRTFYNVYRKVLKHYFFLKFFLIVYEIYLQMGENLNKHMTYFYWHCKIYMQFKADFSVKKLISHAKLKYIATKDLNL